eukprot:357286-Chlamydomonas_euryale.AAC.7
MSRASLYLHAPAGPRFCEPPRRSVFECPCWPSPLRTSATICICLPLLALFAANLRGALCLHAPAGPLCCKARTSLTRRLPALPVMPSSASKPTKPKIPLDITKIRLDLTKIPLDITKIPLELTKIPSDITKIPLELTKSAMHLCAAVPPGAAGPAGPLPRRWRGETAAGGLSDRHLLAVCPGV